MLNFQKEIERILHQVGDYDSFMTDDQFSRCYRISETVLEINKQTNDIVIIFLEDRFEFQTLLYNPAWYPTQVVKGNKVIPIVITYENGRAHSARNWCIFRETSEGVARMLMSAVPQGLAHNSRWVTKEIAFEQMALW
ncbi:hypothetical protein Desaci_1379 [Desulfosporosinus acidiphilus SJ4]|uniref:Uncharacterized protein n=1 Tax=Desulfosporosinus acidiphilus (strain DSM 22704 / JCM 16185 / SJ4) TaxID=646529 RepID=I4D3M8_DESAJ|nr:hypothetical protein [Desulfosporosinus acidiphilus]AFM40402.1 hypothetical protein Desaci_1379 [Desulfosporosinus acidiphilus SJ4]